MVLWNSKWCFLAILTAVIMPEKGRNIDVMLGIVSRVSKATVFKNIQTCVWLWNLSYGLIFRCNCPLDILIPVVKPEWEMISLECRNSCLMAFIMEWEGKQCYCSYNSKPIKLLPWQPGLCYKSRLALVTWGSNYQGNIFLPSVSLTIVLSVRGQALQTHSVLLMN